MKIKRKEMNRHRLAVTALTACLAGLIATSGQTQPAKNPFAPFTGTWQGEFRVYSLEGKLVSRLSVNQHYTWQGAIQKARIVDTYPDGRQDVSTAENFLRNDTLYCVVHKPEGNTAIHIGRVEGDRLFWRHESADGHSLEIFKEYVTTHGPDTLYVIDGLGRYGQGPSATILLFEGRYRKMKDVR